MTSQPKTTSPSTRSPGGKIQGLGGLGQTLRGRLLWTVIPVVILPLLLISGIEYNIINQQATERNLARLEESTRLGRYNTNKFIDKIFNTLTLTASSPLTLNALRSSAITAQSQGLLKQTPQSLEANFQEFKVIKRDPILNNYLGQIADFEQLAKIFITDKNGFNIAYNSAPSNFVQRNETWWKEAKEQGTTLEIPQIETTTNQLVIPLSEAIRDPKTNEFLGVIKAKLPNKVMEQDLAELVSFTLQASQVIQIIDGQSSSVIDSVSLQENLVQSPEVIGGETISNIIRLLHQSNQTNNASNLSAGKNVRINYDEVLKKIKTIEGIQNARFTSSKSKSESRQAILPLAFEFQDKVFTMMPIPNTQWGAVTTIDKSDFARLGRESLLGFVLTTLLLAGLSTIVIVLLARNLSLPLTFLRQATMQAAEGDLEAKAPIMGTLEMQALGKSFNTLINQVKESLSIQREATQAQYQIRETLEDDIVALMEDMEGAVEGDLTVRAELASQDMSTVADLFNAIIESLRDIAKEVKQSTVQVSQSLASSEVMMQETAEQSSIEAEQVLQTLSSVAKMSQSVQEIAERALQAALMSQEAYTIAQDGTFAMNQTVDSVLSLRNTVGETAKKMKLLGESSQKISQVVSLIDEIALKTNLLAINASVEASRAGEQGQGFTIVAEQVGALAEQSTAATQEIAALISNIQAETQEVSEAMELGTSQVVDSTQLINQSKQSLEKVLQTSQNINELMQSISDTTNTQVNTSKEVTSLMQEITKAAKTRSKSALAMATDIQSTVAVAQSLQSTVQQFKVSKDETSDDFMERPAISTFVDSSNDNHWSSEPSDLDAQTPSQEESMQNENVLVSDEHKDSLSSPVETTQEQEVTATDDSLFIEPEGNGEMATEIDLSNTPPINDSAMKELEITDAELEELAIEEIDLEEISQLTSETTENGSIEETQQTTEKDA